MKVVNFATVSVDTTAGGTAIVSEAQARIAASEGMDAVIVNPSVDIVIIGGPIVNSAIPSAIVGTASNSPLTCPAGVATTILHRSGPVYAISTSGTSTVKFAICEGP